MNAGRVQMLLIIGESNPVQTAPADLNFADAMSKVQTRFHSGMFLDETATLCHWHVPAAHFLEAWSDARTVDGTVSDRAAADSADVWRQVGARDRADAARSPGAHRLRHRARVLDGASRRRKSRRPAATGATSRARDGVQRAPAPTGAGTTPAACSTQLRAQPAVTAAAADTRTARRGDIRTQLAALAARRIHSGHRSTPPHRARRRTAAHPAHRRTRAPGARTGRHPASR